MIGGCIRESCKGYETLREMVGRLVLKPPRRVKDNAPYHSGDSVCSLVYLLVRFAAGILF